MSSKIKINFYTIPATGTIYNNNTAVKTFKIKDHKKLINDIIQNTNGTIFEQLKLKQTIHHVTKVFNPETIIIKEK